MGVLLIFAADYDGNVSVQHFESEAAMEAWAARNDLLLEPRLRVGGLPSVQLVTDRFAFVIIDLSEAATA